jgi:glycosyltransferase involved in cell wall biosynthesis
VRVGLNLVFLTPHGGGVGRYATELLPALLEAEPSLELVGYAGSMVPPEVRDERVRWVDVPAAPNQRRNLAWQMLALPVRARRDGLDVLHSPANVGPLLAPGVRTVVTLLDLIWLHLPDEWESRGAARRTRALSIAAARRADRVIAISEAARDDFVATIGLEAARIDVTPLGVRPPATAPADERALRERIGAGDRPIVLCVAQKRRYKHQEALVRALPRLEDAVVVLPGAPTAYEDDLRALAARLGVADRLLLPDYVSEAELEALYAAATCFVLPSLIEGFGLPVLEAMARGVPVACSDRASLPEVAGEAALLFDPTDDEAVADAVGRLLGDAALRADLVRRGHERVRRFTWARTAEATLASYRRVLEG